ncbi:acrosomal protein KIAA1210 homolog isoform X3 [Hippopotamus amphibius kiboko]|uniref:acrosomal protein KIAA1210 homolog isoform X3 n=1 Tax=Hippopotamus amphibius kiboko TaxID=575201 RepID=UPI002592FF29|nr:acrosomal protein KIAA1210 homolog isoform X3 [Hippopotamus amphibius kiboko]
MAGFYGCLKTQDDPTMAESLSGISGSVEVLEASDEGKKKSKFKVFKCFFGKKKKKEPEDVQGGKRLKPSLSSGNINTSFLKPVPEGQQIKPGAKSSMGNKALSHDSIIILEPEPEGSGSRICPSPEVQRDRPLQIPPLCPCQPSISPPLIQSDTISKDFEEMSAADESPKGPQKKGSSHKMLPLKKSTSPGRVCSQSLTTVAMPPSPTSTQGPAGFSTPATTQGCLESSAARHKMTLNPRKQKKSFQEKPKEEPSLPLASEEETNTTKPKEADQKKPRKDSAGASSQEQGNKTEICEQKTTDQPANTDAAENQGCLFPAAYRTRRGRRASSTSGIDVEARKASTSQSLPEDMEESMVSGLSPHHEDGASGAKKTEARAALLPTVGSPSTSQDIFSVALEDQVFMDSSHRQSEEVDASSFDLKSVKFKMKSAQDTYKEKPPRNVLQDFTASISGTASALVEGGTSVERLPLRSLSLSSGKLKAEAVTSDSESTSEADSGSEQQLSPGYSFQPSKKHRNEQEVFPESESSAVEVSGPERQRAPQHSSQSLGKHKVEAIFSDSKSASGEGSGSEQRQAPGRSLQFLRKSKDGQESGFVVQMRSSDEKLAPRCASQALGEPKDDVSTGSNGYVEKYKSAEDWSSSKEDLPPQTPCQASGRPRVQKEVFSASKNVPEVWGASVQQRPPRHPLQSWVSPASEQAPAGAESAALEWGIALEPLPPRVTSKRLMRQKVEQPVSSGPERATLEGITSLQPPSARPPSKPSVKLIAEQEISAGPESEAVEGRISKKLLPPRHPSQPLVRPVFERHVPLGAARAVVEKSVSMEPLLPRHLFQALMRPVAQQQVSAGPESAAAEGSVSRAHPPSKVLAQPWIYPKAEQKEFTRLEGVAREKVIPVETSLPKCSPQSLTNPQAQKIFSENPAAEEGVLVELLPPGGPSQPLLRPPFRPQTVPLDAVGAPAEGSSPVQPAPPRHTFRQPWVIPTSEQQASAGPESAAVEWGVSMEPLPPGETSQALVRPPVREPISAGPESVETEGSASTKLLPPKHSRSIGRHKVQQMLSTFESVAVVAGISGRSLPATYPAQLVKKSKVQELPSRLESTAVEEGIAKRSVLPKRPSQPFVRFMAQQIFSESPAPEEGISVDPLSPNQPSKSSSRPKVEHQVFSGWESTDIEGGVSLKQLPAKTPAQGLWRPEGLQVFSHSESAPVKWSSSKEQLPPRHLAQVLGKLVYQQEISSAPKSSAEEWRSSEEQLPCRCPGQAKYEAELQPQIFSTGPVSAPAEGSRSEEHLPPRHPLWALADPEHQQPVHSGPMSAAAEGTILESDPSCWSLPRDSASPNKTKKHRRSSKHLIKNILTPATKPVKFADAPPWQTSTSRGTYSKKEVLEGDDQDNSHSSSSTKGADVENLFGVRLRRTSSSQKCKARQQKKPKSESMAKKQPAYRIPGKAPGRQSDYATSEPAWITMVKQRQGSFQANIPVKEPETENRAGAKAETNEPRYGRTGLANESQARSIFTSDVNRQVNIALMKSLKSTKAVGFADEMIFQGPSTEKETRRSSTLPAMLQQQDEPVEPVWFSLAKKKAKAWSHIAETMT